MYEKEINELFVFIQSCLLDSLKCIYIERFGCFLEIKRQLTIWMRTMRLDDLVLKDLDKSRPPNRKK